MTAIDQAWLSRSPRGDDALRASEGNEPGLGVRRSERLPSVSSATISRWCEHCSEERYAVELDHLDAASRSDRRRGDGRNDVVSLMFDRLVWFRGGDWATGVIDVRKLHDRGRGSQRR
jgi:hypothetical protein